MKITDLIADMIMDMFDDETPTVQIQRNDLAQKIGCVPSQINYVITSRFTPEQGYSVESRRGGGGCILITRAKNDKSIVFMHVINSIGESIDEKTLRAHVYNLHYQGLLDDFSAKLILSATNDNTLKDLSGSLRNIIRSRIFKQMLIVLSH